MSCPHRVEIPEGGWSLPEGVSEDGSEEFYMACDCCDYPMHVDCSAIYHNQETGETLCSFCAPGRAGSHGGEMSIYDNSGWLVLVRAHDHIWADRTIELEHRIEVCSFLHRQSLIVDPMERGAEQRGTE